MKLIQTYEEYMKENGFGEYSEEDALCKHLYETLVILVEPVKPFTENEILNKRIEKKNGLYKFMNDIMKYSAECNHMSEEQYDALSCFLLFVFSLGPEYGFILDEITDCFEISIFR